MTSDDFLAAPEIVRRLISQDASENETVTLTCTVQNADDADEDEPYSIAWFFNDKQIHSTEEKYSVDENAKTGICLLTIRQITPDDEGAYRCVASNKFGSSVTTGFLAVIRKWRSMMMLSSSISLGRKRSQSPSPSRNASPNRSLSPSGNRSRDRSVSPLRYINLPMSRLARVTEELEHLIHPTTLSVHEEDEETAEVPTASAPPPEEPILVPEESVILPEIVTAPELLVENTPLPEISAEVSEALLLIETDLQTTKSKLLMAVSQAWIIELSPPATAVLAGSIHARLTEDKNTNDALGTPSLGH